MSKMSNYAIEVQNAQADWAWAKDNYRNALRNLLAIERTNPRSEAAKEAREGLHQATKILMDCTIPAGPLAP